MQRGEIAADLDLGDDVLVDDGASREEICTLDDAVTHSFDVVEGGKHSVNRIHEGVKDELHSELVVGDVDFPVHPFLTGGLVCDIAAGKADLLDDTLCKKVVYVVALHVQELVLDGRASAIDYKDDHIFFFWFFPIQECKVKK